MLKKSIIIEKLREIKEGLFVEIMDQIEKIEKVSTDFNYTNLKIHNVSYYLYQAQQAGLITDGQAQQSFEEISHNEYEYFQEWEKENLNYVSRSYIGRTSSFYYNSNWYGDHIDNGTIEYLLEGKETLKDEFDHLDSRLHSYLLNDIDISGEFTDFDENDFIDWLETELNMLELFKDDLNTVEEIVLEAKKAYDYLKDYKTESNEYALAKEYLSHEIAEYYSQNKAEQLFDRILGEIEYLNQVEKLEFSYTTINNYFVLEIELNDTTFNIDTVISSTHELSDHTMNCIDFELQALIKNNFKF